MAQVRLGIALGVQQTAWSPLLNAAQLVDRLGYDTLWTGDHLYATVGSPHQPVFEGWTTLGAWSTATVRVRLGLMVGANSFRHPSLVAKSAVTLDHASEGRAILGMGAGWLRAEHDAYGIEFGMSAGERLGWLDEAAGLVRRLLDGEIVSHDGPRYRTHRLALRPVPVQSHLPILIGGAGEKKTLRTVAQYADHWDAGLPPTPDVLRRKLAALEAHGEEVGRDVTLIEKSLSLFLCIRDDPREARHAYARVLAANGTAIGREHPEELLWVGPPEYIAQRLEPYLDLGFHHFVAHVLAPHDQETIERFIGHVKPLLS